MDIGASVEAPVEPVLEEAPAAATEETAEKTPEA